MSQATCTFCGAENNTTKITAVGAGTALETDEQNQPEHYGINFMPQSFTFERVKVAAVPGIKSEPVQACQTCTKILYTVVKELKK